MDLPNLSLPETGRLTQKGARANPPTIYSEPFRGTMPLIDKSLESERVRHKGRIFANILFGAVESAPSCPLLFRLKVADLPHPPLHKPPVDGVACPVLETGEAKPTFAGQYEEGLKVATNGMTGKKEGCSRLDWLSYRSLSTPAYRSARDGVILISR